MKKWKEYRLGHTARPPEYVMVVAKGLLKFSVWLSPYCYSCAESIGALSIAMISKHTPETIQ